jgi:hypothetical protein
MCNDVLQRSIDGAHCLDGRSQPFQRPQHRCQNWPDRVQLSVAPSLVAGSQTSSSHRRSSGPHRADRLFHLCVQRAMATCVRSLSRQALNPPHICVPPLTLGCGDWKNAPPPPPPRPLLERLIVLFFVLNFRHLRVAQLVERGIVVGQLRGFAVQYSYGPWFESRRGDAFFSFSLRQRFFFFLVVVVVVVKVFILCTLGN